MKKIIFTLLAFFILLNITYAMDISLKFKSSPSYPPETINTFYKDGYVFVETTNVYYAGNKSFESTISYYDSNGNVLSSKDFAFITEAVVADGDDLFLFVTKENPANANNVSHKYIIKLDSNLNIKKEFFINENINIDPPLFLCNFEKVALKNNEIIIKIHDRAPDRDYYFKVDKGLNNISVENIATFEEDQVLNRLNDEVSNDIYEVVKTTDGYIALKNTPYNCDVPETCEIIPSIIQYDKNYTKKWERELRPYGAADHIVTNEKYIMFLGIAWGINGADPTKDIIIYDYSGNHIKTINNVEASQLALNEKELIFTEGGISLCSLSYFEEDDGCYTKAHHAVYKLVYDINTSIKEGKGHIKVSPFAQSGDGITVEIIPAAGYVLSKAIVTDENGNKIIFSNNTFTMPSADVTIEVVFKPVNPETKDLAITAVILLFIITVGLVTIYSKKIKEIN